MKKNLIKVAKKSITGKFTKVQDFIQKLKSETGEQWTFFMLSFVKKTMVKHDFHPKLAYYFYRRILISQTSWLFKQKPQILSLVKHFKYYPWYIVRTS